MNSYLRFWWCVVLCFGVPVLSVNGSASMGLNEAIELALIHDAQHQAEISGAQARRADGWRAIAGYGPTLSLSASLLESRDSSQPEKTSGRDERTANFEESEITVSLIQPLVDLEKMSVALQGRQEMEISDLQVKKANEDLILKVHERYYNVLSRQENLRLAQAESGALLKQLSHVKGKLDLGFGTITDQYDANARYQLSLASEISKRIDYENAHKALEEIVAHSVDTLEDLDHGAPLPMLPRNKIEWIGFALSNNTDLLLQKSRLEAVRFHRRAVQSRFLPKLSAFADYIGRDAEDGLLGYGEERSEFDAGVRLEMSLLAGGSDTASAVAASRREQEARHLVDASAQSIERSVGSLWDSIHDTESLIKSYRRTVDASRMAMVSTQEAYNEGVKPFLDVLNAQQNYYQALRLYRTSRYDYMVMMEKIRQAAGAHSNDHGVTL